MSLNLSAVRACSRCSRFMRQNRLSMHSRTTVGQKLPDNWEEKVTNFHQFASQRKEELAIQAGRVFNMDEVPMSFDAPYSRTVDTTGAESIPVSTTWVMRKQALLLSLHALSPGKSSSQWSSSKEKPCRKKSSPMVWLSTATTKDGWIEMEWLYGVRKFGIPDLCPSLTVSAHILTKVFATLSKLNTKQLLQ